MCVLEKASEPSANLEFSSSLGVAFSPKPNTPPLHVPFDHESVSTSTRTTNASEGGCWTCRLRRKKCDEVCERDSCRTCERLTIECLGWSPKRPEWMRDVRKVADFKASIKAKLALRGPIRGQMRSSNPMDNRMQMKVQPYVPRFAPTSTEESLTASSVPLTHSSVHGFHSENTLFRDSRDFLPDSSFSSPLPSELVNYAAYPMLCDPVDQLDDDVAVFTEQSKTDPQLHVTQFVLAANNALKHLVCNKPPIEEVFSQYQILGEEYSIHVGFNETAIQAGIGYLEEIHVFLSPDVQRNSDFVEKLGKLFSPFPGVIFQDAECTFAPVFDTDGRIRERDEVIAQSTWTFPSGDTDYVSIVNSGNVLSCARTVADVDNASSAGNVPGGYQGSFSIGSSEKGKGRDDSDDQVPDIPHGNNNGGDENYGGGRGPDNTSDFPTISFDVSTHIYCSEPVSARVFEELKVRGEMIARTHTAQPDGNYSKGYLKFTELRFQGIPKNEPSHYKQYASRVAIDTTHVSTKFKVHKPLQTHARSNEYKSIDTDKDAFTRTLATTLAGVIGLSPSASGSIATNLTRVEETTSAVEITKYDSQILQHDGDGVVWWGFTVDDPHEQKRGMELHEAKQPLVEFEFWGDESTPPPPSHYLIGISSFWSLIPKQVTGEWLRPHHSKITPPYSNVSQLVYLEVPTNLRKKSHYIATLGMGSDGSITTDVKLRGQVEVLPVMHAPTVGSVEKLHELAFDDRLRPIKFT